MLNSFGTTESFAGRRARLNTCDENSADGLAAKNTFNLPLWDPNYFSTNTLMASNATVVSSALIGQPFTLRFDLTQHAEATSKLVTDFPFDAELIDVVVIAKGTTSDSGTSVQLIDQGTGSGTTAMHTAIANASAAVGTLARLAVLNDTVASRTISAGHDLGVATLSTTNTVEPLTILATFIRKD